jgi:hypothetical protein
MNIVKLNGSKVELRKNTIRVIVNKGAVDADMNNGGSLILVTTEKGKVELRKESGTLIRTISNSHAIRAKFSGSEILVKTEKGKTELRKESGTLIKTI